MINYCLLMKPGIILGNLITFAAGFFLASQGGIEPTLFIAALLGLACIIGSGCAFNNYIDRFLDRRMERTSGRVLAQEKVSVGKALFFASMLAVAGNIILALYTNLLTLAAADFGFIVYVLLYSFLKSHTVYSTLIGSISGAVPPVVGYLAVADRLDGGALLLFLMMLFWQMPHFFAIGLWHLEDYKKAQIPILPVTEGALRTKVHMLLYIAGFIPTVALLSLLGYTGPFFLGLTFATGALWLVLALRGFHAECDAAWGRQMFRYSLVMINTICFMIPIELFFG